MKYTSLRNIASVFLFILTLYAGAPLAAVIDKVDVAGNRRVLTEHIAPYLVKEGSEFSPELLNESIKDLYETGYFLEISVDAAVEDNLFVLTYLFKEVPIVAEIEFEGNEHLSDIKTEEILTFKVGEQLNFMKIAATLKNIRTHYEKEHYYSATVEYEILYRSEQAVSILFKINEGKTSKVYNIWFYGNENLTTMELKDVMQTKEKDFWSIMNSSGTLYSDMLKADIELIRNAYFSKGYIYVEIGEPEIVFQSDLSKINYLVKIQEGPQFKVNKVTVEDATDTISHDNLTKLVNLKEGDIFDVSVYRGDISRLTRAYADLGRARANIDAGVSENKVLQTVDITYSIIPGNIYYIGRIVFKGNDSSKDNVLRREFDIVEGDRYHAGLLEEGEANLYATGFFETVSISEHFTGDNSTDILVEVREKKNRTLNLAIMYSSRDQLAFSLEFAYINLFGYGSSASIGTQLSRYRQYYSLNYSEPWIFDNPYSWGGRLYYDKEEYDYYDYRVFGASLRLGHQLIKRRLDVSLTGAHERIDLRNIDDRASKYIKKQEGLAIINSLSPYIVYQNLNNRLDPSDGYSLGATLRYAGTFLGGTEDFVETLLHGKYYQPLTYRFVFAANAEIGRLWQLTDKPLPVSKRYYLGGITSVRGFKYQDISPLDEDGDPYGGDKKFQGNLEIWRPLVDGQMAIRGVIFFDAGQVVKEGQELFTKVPRHSIGGGLRFYTPIGLLRLEYGYKLDKKSGEEPSTLEFSVGSVF